MHFFLKLGTQSGNIFEYLIRDDSLKKLVKHVYNKFFFFNVIKKDENFLQYAWGKISKFRPFPIAHELILVLKVSSM